MHNCTIYLSRSWHKHPYCPSCNMASAMHLVTHVLLMIVVSFGVTTSRNAINVYLMNAVTTKKSI